MSSFIVTLARTSTFALTNVTLPYALEIANKGLPQAIGENGALKLGVNLYKGAVTCPGVAQPMACVCEDISALAA